MHIGINFNCITINILPLLFKYTEEEIISKLKERNQKCFADVYDYYSGAIYMIIYRMIQNTPLAEKVLKETFIEAWNTFENYDRAKERTFTWIANIAKDKIIKRTKRYRNKQKSIKRNQPINEEKSIINYTTGSVSFLIDPQEGSLKNDQKQIIELAYFGCFTVKQISKKLLMPPETVKSKLRMAIVELRKLNRGHLPVS
jgi:RNA polymerase sigma factor (sigma-70 family)